MVHFYKKKKEYLESNEIESIIALTVNSEIETSVICSTFTINDE